MDSFHSLGSQEDMNVRNQDVEEPAIVPRKPSPSALLNLEIHRDLIELFPMAAYAVRAPDGVITWFNSRAAELWGREPIAGATEERFCGAHKLYHADGTYMPHSATPVALALKSGTSVRGEEVIIERPDGSRIPVSVHIDPIRDPDGKIVGVVNFFYDTRERKQAERTAGLLAAIVDSSDDAIVSKNFDGIITSWNKGAERMFGHTAAEAVGQHITLIVPYERRQEETMILDRLRRGERIEHFETARVCKDGTTLDISLTISPVRDSTGRLIGASKVARDITERKRTERALAKQARLLDLSTDAIFVRNAADQVTYWNEAASHLYGYTCEEALGRVTHELLRTKFQAPLESINEQLHRDGFWTGELIHRRKDGAQVVVASRWVIDRGPDGNPWSVLETNTDITGRKEAEEATRESELSARLLQVQDEERRRIARELHDGIGQLLTAMTMNAARVAKEKSNLSPEAARCADENSNLTHQVLNDIRTVSYLLHPPLLDEMGLRSALEWYIRGFAERSKIAARLDLGADLDRLPQDHELCLFRIAQECLTNVHRHSGSSTALVRLSRASGEVTMQVKDEGCGLKHAEGGFTLGVGLRGMRERLKQLGGSLEIQANGGGTTVTARLPYRESPPMTVDGSVHDPASKKYDLSQINGGMNKSATNANRKSRARTA